MIEVTYLGESKVPMGDRQPWVADEAHQSRGKGSHCEGQIPWRPLGGTRQAAEGQRKLPVKARKRKQTAITRTTMETQQGYKKSPYNRREKGGCQGLGREAGVFLGVVSFCKIGSED